MTWMTEELQQLEHVRRKRQMHVVDMAEGARVTIAGRSLLNFSSNDYLHLSRHPQVIEAVRQVVEHWGTGATSSRLLSGTSVIHQDLEMALAAFLKRDSALVFSSGFMTNLGVVTSLVGEGDAVIVDRLDHASLIDAARMSGARLFVYAHRDLADAEKTLQRAASYRRRLLITDGLFSMDGDFAPDSLAALCRRYETQSMIDDAHAMGVWGPEGRGHSDGFDVMVGTLSKTLGSQGGFVAASREIMELILNRARTFVYTTGLAPSCVAAAQAALSLIQEDPQLRERLLALSQRLREGLTQAGFDILGSESQIVPILLGTEDKALALAAFLNERGMYAPAIRPPTVPAGECRLRFSVTTAHSEKDIDALIESVTLWRQQHG